MTAHALPVYQRVVPSHRHESPSRPFTGSKTELMAHRIIDASEEPFDRYIEQVGLRMLRCGTDRNGFRCSHSTCPRCSVRTAKKNYARLAATIAALPRGTKLAHLTLTTGADSIPSGHKTLFGAFSRWRRAKACSPMLGGYVHGEVLPASGGSRAWNVHLHAVVEVKGAIELAALAAAWRRVLARDDVPGSVTWTNVTRRTVEDRRGGRFLAARVLRDQAKTSARLERLHRRAAPRARARLRRAALGRSLRVMDAGGAR